MTFTTAPSLPVNNTVTGTISNDTCFNASNVLTVAGNGSSMIVANGGRATFVAGQKISFLPGTQVLPGGYLHGYITTNGQYCNMQTSPVVSNTVTPDELKSSAVNTPSDVKLHVWPNPASASVTIELTGQESGSVNMAGIYNLNGMKVISVELSGSEKHLLDVSMLPTGIYFVKVTSANGVETTKLIKM